MKTKVGDFVKICIRGQSKSYLTFTAWRVEKIWRGMVGIREFQFMRKRSYHRSWVRVHPS